MKVIVLLVMCGSLFAADGKFEERKSKVLAKLDQEASLISDTKSCVSSATEKGQIKECMKSFRSKKKSMHSERREMRRAHRAERKARLQEKMDKLDRATEKSPQ